MDSAETASPMTPNPMTATNGFQTGEPPRPDPPPHRGRSAVGAPSSDTARGRAPGPLRVLLHDYGGYAFIAQLARELARRDHDVHHVHYASLRSGKGRLSCDRDDPPSLTFSSIELPEGLDRYAVVDRFRLERAYARQLVAIARSWRPDVVLCANTPLMVVRSVRSHLDRGGIPLVDWLQDLHSVAMGDELVRRVGWAGRGGALVLRTAESRLLRSCAAVVCVSDDFVPILRRWQVPSERLVVVPNWAELGVPSPRRNGFSGGHGLDDRVTLLYAGTLGLKHEPLRLVALAEAFRDRPDVAVVVVSEGLGRRWLEQERRTRQLTGLMLVDFQPHERVGEVLGTGDVLLSMIRAEAARFSAPSKVLAYLAGARSQLAAIPSANLAARVLSESGGGLVVEPDDTNGWVDAARRLVDDAGLRSTLARAGRAYAEKHFDVGLIADRFETVLRGVAIGRV